MKFVLSFASTEKYAIVNKFEFQKNTKSLKVDSFYNGCKPDSQWTSNDVEIWLFILSTDHLNNSDEIIVLIQ